MTALPVIGFMVVALAAIAFAAVPLLRAKVKKRGGLIAAGLALFVLVVGSGAYWMVGKPYLAQREAQGTDALTINEPTTLIPLLIKRTRDYPGDARALQADIHQATVAQEQNPGIGTHQQVSPERYRHQKHQQLALAFFHLYKMLL